MKICLLITLAVLFIGIQAGATSCDATDGEECQFNYGHTGIKYNGSCYYFEKDYRWSFQSSKWWCEYVMNAAFFVPQSIEENNFIMSKTADMAFTWTGISQKKEQKWEQISKINLNELKWDDWYWSRYSPDRCAVSKNIHGKSKLYWTSCKETHYFICEAKNKREVFTQPPQTTTTTTTVATTAEARVETVKCDDGWLLFETSCYFIERTEKATFENAKSECRSKDATLFTPETKDEYKTLMANTVVYAHTWTETAPHQFDEVIEVYYGNSFIASQMDWLVKPYNYRSNGYMYVTSTTCAAYYNGYIDSAKYYYYYPCDWKFLYICEKKATVEYI